MLEVLYGVPPVCVYFSINLNCSDKSMKITNFSLTIEISKDKDGYPNSYYVNVDESGVNVSHPYIKQPPEEFMFTTELIRDFVGMTAAYNARVDGFNRDNHLEQYALIVPPQIETTGSDFDLDAKSAVAQVAGGGSEEIDNCPPSTEESKEEVIIATVRGSSNEGLTMIGEE